MQRIAYLPFLAVLVLLVVFAAINGDFPQNWP